MYIYMYIYAYGRHTHFWLICGAKSAPCSMPIRPIGKNRDACSLLPWPVPGKPTIPTWVFFPDQTCFAEWAQALLLYSASADAWTGRPTGHTEPTTRLTADLG